MTRRIEEDTVGTGARQWRPDHITAYARALPWLREEGEIVPTAGVTPREVVRRIADAVVV